MNRPLHEAIAGAMKTDYVGKAKAHFGSGGSETIKMAIRFISAFFQKVDSTIFAETPLHMAFAMEGEHAPGTTQALTANWQQQCKQAVAQGEVFLWIDEAGNAHFLTSNNLSAQTLSQSLVVFTFRQDKGVFVMKTETIPTPEQNGRSLLTTPTYTDLVDALDSYRARDVLYCQCPIINRAWVGGERGRRIMLVNKPEAHLRNSLHYFLRVHLRNADSRLEQNVDDTHPVDIKVVWAGPAATALIEVKWLGVSQNEAGTGAGTSYSAARAREGAQQLAEYLEDEAQHASNPENVRGYLFVFDARRRGVGDGSKQISVRDATYYESEDIDYDAKHLERPDFATPIRAFMRARHSECVSD